VDDLSDGFWRRWLVLPFERSFKSKEQKRDLAKEIIASERAEIASWALVGASYVLARNDYEVPTVCREALNAWRRNADTVAGFLEESTTFYTQRDDGGRKPT